MRDRSQNYIFHLFSPFRFRFALRCFIYVLPPRLVFESLISGLVQQQSARLSAQWARLDCAQKEQDPDTKRLGFHVAYLARLVAIEM
jgi:hypothetical protein